MLHNTINTVYTVTKKGGLMTTYTWTDNAMRSGTSCDVDKVADNLMHLKYNAGGLLPINDLGTKTSNFTLEVNKIDLANITSSLTISLPTTGFISGVENKCVLIFTTSSSTSPSLPSGLKWSGKSNGQAPSSYSTVSGVKNVLIFTTFDNGTTWQAEYQTYGILEQTFSQPTLSANGTLGGSSFAVYSNSVNAASVDTYKAVDGDNSTRWQQLDGATGVYFVFYNPNALKVSNLNIRNLDGWNYAITGYTIYGSNDNSNWTTITSGTNSVITASANWDISIPEANKGFYKYYKIYASSVSVVAEIATLTISATYIAS